MVRNSEIRIPGNFADFREIRSEKMRGTNDGARSSVHALYTPQSGETDMWINNIVFQFEMCRLVWKLRNLKGLIIRADS